VPNKTSRILLALGAFLVLAISLGGCGSSVPGNAVATVNGSSITKSDFDHWFTVTAKGSSGVSGQAVIPDPPAYTNCIAALRKQARPARGQPAPTNATLLGQCKAQYHQLVEQVMGTLIQTSWIQEEAKHLGVSASEGEIKTQLQAVKKQSFPTEAAYQRFLKQSGMSPADITLRIRVQVLAQKITRKIQGQAATISQSQISNYYNRNQAQFSVPERRDLEQILARTKAKAQAAKSAVQGGMSWRAAVRKYSSNKAAAATGGVIRGIAKGQQDPALDKVVFAAKKGVISGPLRGQLGWYVVRVTNVTPPSKQTLAQATAQIKALLTQQGSQQKMAKFITDFQKRWKNQTKCSTNYVIALCSNAPKPKTTSSGTSTH
jgi:foldase protein PrsA